MSVNKVQTIRKVSAFNYCSSHFACKTKLTFLSSFSQAIYPLLSWYWRPKYLKEEKEDGGHLSQHTNCNSDHLHGQSNSNVPGFSEPNCPTHEIEELLSSCLEKILIVNKRITSDDHWPDHLVVQAELELGVHGADLDGEHLAHLLPPEQQGVQCHF